MPSIPKITVYTNDGTEVLGSVNLTNYNVGGYTVYVNNMGVSGTATPSDGYIYMMVPVNGLEFRKLQMQHLQNMVPVHCFLFQQVLQYMP